MGDPVTQVVVGWEQEYTGSAVLLLKIQLHNNQILPTAKLKWLGCPGGVALACKLPFPTKQGQ